MPYICKMDSVNAYRLERLFVWVIEDVGMEKGLNHSKVARAAFPEMPDPVKKWRQLRNISWGDKPQVLSLRDAARLAAAVGQTVSEIAFKAEQHLKAGTKPSSFQEPETPYGAEIGDAPLSEVAEQARAYGRKPRRKKTP